MSPGQLRSEIVPILESGQLVLFPGMHCTVQLGSPSSKAALRAARERPELTVAVFASRLDADRHGGADHLHRVGTLARATDRGPCPRCGRHLAEIVGTARVRMDGWRQLEPFRAACCHVLDGSQAIDADVRRLAFLVSALTDRIHRLFPGCAHTRRASERLASTHSPDEIVGAVGGLLLHLPTVERQRLLELEPLGARLEEVLLALHERLARTTPSNPIH